METLIGNNALSWLCICVFFALAEVFFPRYIFVWLSTGASGAIVATLFGAPLWGQITVFCVVSALLLQLFRRWSKEARGFDTMSAIQQEDGIQNDTVRLNRNLTDFFQDGAGTELLQEDRDSSGLFPERGEGETICEDESNPEDLH